MTETSTPPAKISDVVDGQALGSSGTPIGAAAILRGVQRMMQSLRVESLTEVPLPNGRRADILCLSTTGEFNIVEVKSGVADFRADQKWPDYRAYCDRLYFAIPMDFPLEILPSDCGVIVADAFGAEIVRNAPITALPAARRKSMTLLFARSAAMRLQAMLDPGFDPGLRSF